MFNNVRRPAGIFGVPMDLGQDRRGVDMGPSAIRYARLQAVLEELGYPVTDLGNAGTPIPEVVDQKEEIRHLAAVRGVCEEVAKRAAAMVSDGLFPIFLGGDHSISIGTVSGVARSFGRGVLTACMLLGRLESFTVLALLSPAFWRR